MHTDFRQRSIGFLFYRRYKYDKWCFSLSSRIVDLYRIPTRLEDSITTTERLGARTHTLEDLAARHTLRVDEIVGEIGEVGAEVVDVGAGGDEAEDGHLAVDALVELPAVLGEGDGGNGGAGAGDGAGAAEGGQPDHEFEFGGAGGRGGGEEVVCDVGDEV